MAVMCVIVCEIMFSKKGFRVRSFGTGTHVKLPGAAPDRPNVYDFSTTYDEIYNDLWNKDRQTYTLVYMSCHKILCSSHRCIYACRSSVAGDTQLEFNFRYMYCSCSVHRLILNVVESVNADSQMPCRHEFFEVIRGKI